MQKGQNLSFDCQSCGKPIAFSVFGVTQHPSTAQCPHCEKQYTFDDPQLVDHLQKFEGLCRQIYESRDILGNASVGIDIQEHQVKVPFKILLTRLTSQLDLVIGEQRTPISFRFEPLSEIKN